MFALSVVFDAVARAIPGRDLFVRGDLHRSYAEVNARADGVAHFLAARGHGLHTERGELAGHEAGQDLVGICLRNGPEFLEAMVGAFRARGAPFNVNYRYVEEELEYLLRDAGTAALVFHAEFAPQVAAVAQRVPTLRTLIQVADESGNRLLPAAFDYESLVTTPPPAGLPEPSGDDLYVAYTGGTTGMPKGVLWRQHDIFVSSMGGTPWGTTEPFASYQAIARSAEQTGGVVRLLLATPLMHAAAQWAVFQAVTMGGTLVLPPRSERFDAGAVLETAAREKVLMMPVIGDAFARPLVEELEQHDHDLSGLLVVINSSAPLSPAVRARLLEALPHVAVLDAVGSSETGAQMDQSSKHGAPAETALFTPQADTAVLDDGCTRVLDEGEGWLARRTFVPLGYLGDAGKSAATFPVVDGVRWAVPGDRARARADGRIELLGRGSVTINSGGEKVFVEEVERALAHHPDVRDVVVVGRPSERWGSEPVALVQLAGGSDATDEELMAECARHVARYKVPKAVLRYEQLERSPSGKADYRWARAQAVGSITE